MTDVLEIVTRVLRFVAFLGVLVFIHELGHFLFSKLFKIEVEEFGFGFPPRMVKLFRLGETDFTLNWIPFGAFVRPKGETDPGIPGGMASAPAWQRFFILLGGPLFNLVLALIVYMYVFTAGGAPLHGVVSVGNVSPDSPASVAGLQTNDYILSIEGQSINEPSQLISIVKQNLDKEVELVYSRDGKTGSVRLTPRSNPPEGQGAVGILLGTPIVQVNTLQAVPFAAYEIYFQAETLVSLPGKLLRGEISTSDARLVGPIGMEEFVYQAAKADEQAKTSDPNAQPLVQLSLFAFISAALGITNLLPLPALDGGRILLSLPEILFRKRIPAEMENVVHFVGFVALVLMLFIISGQDIQYRWFTPK